MILTAGMFIIRRDGKLLICHPTNHSKNFYSIPKGIVDSGELPFDSAYRETFEETNIDLKMVDRYDLFELKPSIYKTKLKTLHPFLFIEREDSKFDWNSIEIKCNSNVSIEIGGFPEVDEFRWVTLEEAITLLHEAQRKCFQEIHNLIK